MLNLFQRWPCRPHALSLQQYDRMIDIVEAIQRRESAESEVSIGPEHGKL
jgi:hypothetical protein